MFSIIFGISKQFWYRYAKNASAIHFINMLKLPTAFHLFSIPLPLFICLDAYLRPQKAYLRRRRRWKKGPTICRTSNRYKEKNHANTLFADFRQKRFPRFLIRIPQIYYTFLHSRTINPSQWFPITNELIIQSFQCCCFFSFEVKRCNQAIVMAPLNIMSNFFLTSLLLLIFPICVDWKRPDWQSYVFVFRFKAAPCFISLQIKLSTKISGYTNFCLIICFFAFT